LCLIKILKIKDEYLPFLSEISTLEKFPFVQVDMGAVKFMCKGANLMRPGIKKFSEFSKDDIVCIVEESQNKFLAIGKSEVDSSELSSMDKGEVLKNLHYISDKAWEISKTL
jgi:PUA domain protein